MLPQQLHFRWFVVLPMAEAGQILHLFSNPKELTETQDDIAAASLRRGTAAPMLRRAILCAGEPLLPSVEEKLTPCADGAAAPLTIRGVTIRA